jgi:Zn-dependent protease
MSITFRVLRFPITIGFAFPAFLLILGYISQFEGIELVIWVVFGTAAILLHELGHAVVFRHYGLESSIRFWALGGLAIPDDQVAAANLPDRQMLLVSLAGPAVGLVLGAAGLALGPVVAEQSHGIRFAVGIWTFVNLGWGIFNLLPISGLDGGHVITELTMVALGERGRAVALAASIVSSALVAVLAVAIGYPYVALIAVMFGLANPYQYRALIDELFPARAARRRQQAAEKRRQHPFYLAEEVPASSLLNDDQEPPLR